MTPGPVPALPWGIPPWLGAWIEAGLALVYPDACQLCGVGHAQRDGGYVCPGCRRGLKFIEGPSCRRCGLPFDGDFTGPFTCANCADLDLHFHSASAAVRAEGIALEVIHRYKYRRALWFEPLLGGLLTGHALPGLAGERWDAVVPVPLHPVREREREFNQAGRLGRILAGALGTPLEDGWVERHRATPSQTHLRRNERHRNVESAFRPRRGLRLDGGRFVVVDDVLTTGATTNAVARILRRAGAEVVVVRTVARGV